MQTEREHEAKNPGPEGSESDSTPLRRLIVETTNVTSANSNRKTIFGRKAHLQLIQETCLTKAQRIAMQKEARLISKQFEGGPTDPEQAKAAAGVGIVSVEGISVYPIAKPIKDYLDAAATGRCAIYCMDVSGVTMAIAVIYGWTGAKKGSPEAARTDDLLTIIQMQFEAMEPGPKLIAGDLNGTPEAFQTINAITKARMDGHRDGEQHMRWKARTTYLPGKRWSPRKQDRPFLRQ